MKVRSTKICTPVLSLKRSFLFLFTFFVFLLLCHILKLETKRSFQLSPNVLNIPENSVISVTKSTEDVSIMQHNNTESVIEDTVLFPDFVLVIIVATNDNNVAQFRTSVDDNRIDCVYNTQSAKTSAYRILSVDELDSSEARWSVRCPLPPANHSALIGLKVDHNDASRSNWLVQVTEDQALKLWNKMLVYDAAFDGEDTVAVFVKGLRLNGERRSDPTRFSCRFGKDYEFVTKAITAAQEVIRCPLPLGVTKSTIAKDNQSVQVTIEKAMNPKVRENKPYILPSIAKLYASKDNKDYKQGNYKKYELCACTMVWNQAEFMREWVIYHSWLGIQSWFVYDNNSDDELEEVINDLDSKNYNVSRHGWPWVKSQEAGFSHCLLRAREQCDWVAFIDVDEFYRLPPQESTKKASAMGRGHGSLLALVKNVSTSSPSKGQIRTNCYDFGPSGLKKSPEQGVTLGYTCRLRGSTRHKSIVRPRDVDESLLNRIHHFGLKRGISGMTLPRKTAVVNHYKYQVWDVFKAKFVRRVSAYVSDWQDESKVGSNDRAPGLGTQAIEPPKWDQKFCQVWDTGLRDFILANLPDPNTTLLPWQRLG